jgi:hypothetical protein
MADTMFNPNRLTFEEGVERIRRAVEEAELSRDTIVTSRDDAALKAMDSLAVDNVPAGFRKWQLPVFLNRASQLYISVGEPGVKVPRHAHEEGDGIRFIAGGSIIYEDKELSAGDWMFIPAGQPYSFEVGRVGAIMCYCYCCSCA